MAFGFPASYCAETKIDKPEAEVFDSIKEILKKLNWPYLEKENEILASASITLRSWGEKIKFSIKNGNALLIESKCVFQVFDWGKNKNNVDRFLNEFQK